MELDCVLGVDAVEVEVLIDGRDMQNEESVGAGNIEAEHYEDERTEVGNALTPKKRIYQEKRNRHKPFIEGAQFDDHHDTGKRKRRKYEKKKISSQHPIEDVQPYSEHNSFECRLCHRRFSQKVYLNRHIMTHTGEKPYECEICHRRFNQKVHLNTHFITHTGEKPFKCEVCHFECNQKANLQRHLKTHTGEKSFKCEVCNFVCNQKVNLLSHLKKHNQAEEVDDDVMIYVRNDGMYVAKLY